LVAIWLAQTSSRLGRFLRDSSLPFTINLSLLNGRYEQLTEHGSIKQETN
jgi:hypothetical protein